MALEARENGSYHKAKEYLEEVLKLDEHYAPALLGLIVVSHDLGLFQEASDVSEYMLVHNIGDYGEVLSLYVVSLIQLEEYSRVCEILANLIDKKKLSPTKVEEFEDILRTCSLLMDAREEEKEDQAEPILRSTVEERLVTDKNYVQKLINELDEGEFDQQLQAIEQLKYVKDETVIKSLRNYCILLHVDPVLKTFALRALKFLDVKEKVLVYKFDRLIEVSLDEIPADEDGLQEDQRKVIELLAQQTYHEDPIFVSFAMQLWIEYLFASFPIIPPLHHTASWSAALHIAVAEMLEQEQSQAQISRKYGTTIKTMNKQLKCLKQFLSPKINAWKSQHLPKDRD